VGDVDGERSKCQGRTRHSFQSAGTGSIPVLRSASTEPFDPDDYEVRPVPFQDAKRMIVAHHYTHSLTKGRFCFGLFRGDSMVGTAVFGQPSGRGVATSIWKGGNERNTLELLRLWVDDTAGRNAESWFLSRCLKSLPKECKAVVAYSAPGAGHYGGCYQAANFICLGRSKSGQNYHYVDKSGRYVNKRIPWQFGPRSGQPDISEQEASEILQLTKVNEGRKYVYVFCRKRRMKLIRDHVPFPKPDWDGP
jgi:hypothetical protein